MTTRISFITGVLLQSVIALGWFAMPATWACPCSEITQPTAGDAVSIEEGLKFSYSKEYDKEFAAAVEGARQAAKAHLGETGIAIVSDIDETVLDNREALKRPGFDWDDFAAWAQQSKAPPLPLTADFLRWARENGFAVFFITGRYENLRGATIRNLLNVKLSYDGLYMRPDNDGRKAEELKSQYRKQIEELGFKVIVNIGDQYSDLSLGHAESCEKLPNKMYFIP